MTSTNIRTEWVKVQNGDLQIDAYLAQPDAPGTYPGIIVIQEIFGVNEHIRDITERIAKEGYVAIAPAIYQRLAPGFEVGYSPEDVQLGREYKVQTQAEELLGDMQSAIDYLKTLPNVKAGGMGSIGFCFGGHVVYLGAILEEIKATASFYGAGVATLTPGGGEPTLTRTKEIKGTVYAFFGKEDPLISLLEVEAIAAELKKCNVLHQIFCYDRVKHGFFCDRRSDYDESSARDAWQKVLQLFSSTL
ncbi:MAG: dienelactone hydrolase family protein [Spirulina sp.]